MGGYRPDLDGKSGSKRRGLEQKDQIEEVERYAGRRL
jgi:hypothetical protein